MPTKSWKINLSQFLDKNSEVLHQAEIAPDEDFHGPDESLESSLEVPAESFQPRSGFTNGFDPVGLLLRLGMERGSRTVVSSSDLQRGLSDALWAYDQGHRHYLTANRRQTLAVLFALGNLNPDFLPAQYRDKNFAEILAGSERAEYGAADPFRLFIEATLAQATSQTIAANVMVRGAFSVYDRTVEKLTDWSQFVAAIFVDPERFRSDIYITPLLKDVVSQTNDILRSTSGRKWHKATKSYQASGVTLLSQRETVAIRDHLENLLAEHSDDLGLIDAFQKNPKLLQDFKGALQLIAALGGRPVAKKAAGALAEWEAGTYLEMARTNLGKVNPNTFPQFDGANREAAIAFVKSMMPPMDGFMSKDEVWGLWKNAWDNTDLKADDISMDLDETVYDYKWIQLWRKEQVRVFKLLISLMAFAYRDKQPIFFNTHSSAGRIADFANHPLFAAFRFAFFLRTKDDPPLTKMEVLRYDNGYTYERLAMESKSLIARVLKEVKEALKTGSDAEKENVAQKIIEVAGDMVKAGEDVVRTGILEKLDAETLRHIGLILRKAVYKTYRGDKNLSVTEATKHRIHVDNHADKVFDFIKGGGKGGIITGHYNYDPKELFQIMVLMKKAWAANGNEPIVVDMRGTALTPEKDPASTIIVNHKGIPFIHPYTSSFFAAQGSRWIRSYADWKAWSYLQQEAGKIPEINPRHFHVQMTADGPQLVEVHDLYSGRFTDEELPFVGPALWNQMMVKNGDPRQIKLSSRARNELVSFFRTKRYALEERVTGLDPSLLFDELAAQFQFDPRDKNDAKNNPWKKEILDVVAAARLGQDNFLVRMVDGFIAAALINIDPEFLSHSENFDLKQNFLPLWYALHLACDTVKGVHATGERRLWAHFNSGLRKLRKLYISRYGAVPSNMYTWRHVKKFDREVVDFYFAQEILEDEAAQKRDTIPSDFPILHWEPTPTQQVDVEPAPTSVAAAVDTHLAESTPWDGVAGFTDFVTVTREGTTWVLQAKTHQPEEEGEVSLVTSLKGANATRKAGAAAFQALSQKDDTKFDQIGGRWGAEMVGILGARVEIEGYDQLDPNKIYIFATSHGSNYDIPFLFAAFSKFHMGYIVKKELTKYLPVLKVSKRFVIRGKGDEKEKMQAALQADYSFFIHPGSTRARGRIGPTGQRIDGDMFARSRLKLGAAFTSLDLLKDKGKIVEIVPVTLMGPGRILPPGAGRTLTNQTVRIVIGHPISPEKFAGQPRLEAGQQMTDEVEAFYRDHFDAPLSPNKGELPFEKVSQLLSEATPIRNPFAKDKVVNNPERKQLDSFLDYFRDAFIALDKRDDNALLGWAKSKNGSVVYAKDLYNLLLTGGHRDEIDAALARAKVDLLKAPKGLQGNFADSNDTTHRARDSRVGWNAVGNIFSSRFSGDRTTQLPPVRLEAGGMAATTAGADLQAKRQEQQAKEANGFKAFVWEPQMRHQSARFQADEARWLQEFETAKKPYVEAFQRYVDDYSQAKHADYAPVDEAIYQLHKSIVDSPLFVDVDSDLRIWKYYTWEARDAYENAVANHKEPNQISLARQKYFGHLSRGIRYRVLNDVARVFRAQAEKTDPQLAQLFADYQNNPTDMDVLRKLFADKRFTKLYQRNPAILKLRAVSEKVEILGTLIYRNVGVDMRLKEVEDELARLKNKIWPRGLRGLQSLTFSYSLVAFRKLSQEKIHLEALKEEYGQASPESMLASVAGEKYALFNRSDLGKLDAHLEANALSVLEQKRDVALKHAQWVADSRAEAGQFLRQRMEVYKLYFDAEYKTHLADFGFQGARYEDLMSQARTLKGFTPADEIRYQKALGAYRLKMRDYLDFCQAMLPEDSKNLEPFRKKKEMVLHDWLALHWAATDILKLRKSPSAGQVKLISAMFPNQTVWLNRLASKDFENLLPVIGATTPEQVRKLGVQYKTVPDPRVIGDSYAQWGLDGVRRGGADLLFYGAGTMRGTLGQSTANRELVDTGQSPVKPDQLNFGFIPQAVSLAPDHMAFGDFNILATLYGLGWGNACFIFEGINFLQLPVLGAVLGEGDGRDIYRAQGFRKNLYDILESLFRGVSMIGFDHATMRLTTGPDPLNPDGISSFLGRPFLMGGSAGLMGMAARDANVPAVPVFQNADWNLGPDIKMSGAMKDNLTTPYSIGQGGRRGGRTVIAMGTPIPGEIFPRTAQDLVAYGFEDAGTWPAEKVEKMCGRVIASMTEVGRTMAWADTVANPPPALQPTPPQTLKTQETPKSAVWLQAGSAAMLMAGAIQLAPSPALGAVPVARGDSILVQPAPRPQEEFRVLTAEEVASVAAKSAVQEALQMVEAPSLAVTPEQRGRIRHALTSALQDPNELRRLRNLLQQPDRPQFNVSAQNLITVLAWDLGIPNVWAAGRAGSRSQLGVMGAHSPVNGLPPPPVKSPPPVLMH